MSETFDASRFELVANQPAYWEFIRALRNDPRVKAGFVQQEHISPEGHEAYMASHASSYFIGLCDGAPAGFIGVVAEDIRICTHPDFQRRGLGLFMLRELARQQPTAVARIKVGNEASLRLFEKAGFEVAYYLLERQTD